MKKISRENFNLNKVKFLKDGMEIYYEHVRDTEHGKFIDKRTVECDEMPHPDLLNVLNYFRSPLAICINSLLGTNVLMKNTLVVDHKKVPAKTRNKYQNEIDKTLQENILVKGISFHSNDKHEIIKLSGGITSALGYTGINSPNIKITDALSKHGIDPEEMEKKVEALKWEVYQYVEEGKRAQAQLNFDKKEEKVA